MDDYTRKKLQEIGINPDQYEVDQPGAMVDAASSEGNSGANNPTSQLQGTKLPEAQSSLGGSIGRSFAYNVPNAAVGLGSASLALKGLQKLPVAGVPGALIKGGGAIATAMLTGGPITEGLKTAGSELIGKRPMLEGFRERLAQDLQEHKYGALGGMVLSDMVGLKPGLTALKQTGRGAIRALSGSAPTAAQVASGVNVGLGAAVPVGAELYGSYSQDRPVDLGSLLFLAAGGAAMNEPNRLGRNYLGLKPTQLEPADFLPQLRKDQSNPANVVRPPAPIPEVKIPEAALTQNAPQAIPQVQASLAEANALKTQAAATQAEAAKISAATELKVAESQLAQAQSAAEQVAQPKLPLPEPIRPSPQFKSPEIRGPVPAEGIKLLSEVPEGGARLREYTPEGDVRVREEAKLPEGAPRVLPTPDIVREQPVIEKPVVSLREAPQIAGRMREGVTPGPIQPKPQSPPTLLERPGYREGEGDLTSQTRGKIDERPIEQRMAKYQEGSAPTEKPIPFEQAQSQLRGKFPITRQWESFFKNILGKVRGVDMTSGKIVNGGREMAGMMVPREGVVNAIAHINPSKAGVDTWPHEVTEAFWTDLESGPSLSGRKFLEDMSAKIASTPEYKDWVSKRPPGANTTPREFAIENSGIDFVRRALESKSEFGELMKDFWATVKRRYGNASAKDYYRLLSGELMYRQPYAEEFTPEAIKAAQVRDAQEIEKERKKASGVKFQEGDESTGGKVQIGKSGHTISEQHDPYLNKIEELLDSGNIDGARKLYSKYLSEIKPEEGLTLDDLRARSKGAGWNLSEQELKYDLELAQVTNEYINKRLERIDRKFEGTKFQEGGEQVNAEEMQGRKETVDPRFEEMRRAVDTSTARPLPPIQRELPLEGDAAKFAEMRRATETPPEGTKFQEASAGETESKTDEFDRIRSMSPDDFMTYSQEQEGGFSTTAIKLGEQIRDTPTLAKLQTYLRESIQKQEEYFAQDMFQEGVNESYKGQFFSEAYGAATGTGASKGRPSPMTGIEGIKDAKFQEASDILNEPQTPGESEFTPSENNSTSAFRRENGFLPFLVSKVDKIYDTIRTPAARYVSDKLHMYFGEMDLLTGRIGNEAHNIMRQFSPEENANVYRYSLEKDAGIKEPSLTLTPNEEKLFGLITDHLKWVRQHQIDMGLEVKTGKGQYRVAGIKPGGYMFNMLDPKVAHAWTQKFASPEANRYKNLYVKHLVDHGVSPEDALKEFAGYKAALGNEVTDEVKFGAVRKAESFGLPIELVDPNFASAFARYSRRVARDFAYFKHIQSDPRMLKALNLKDQFGNRVTSSKISDEDMPEMAGQTAVKNAMRSVFGHDKPMNPRIEALTRLGGNLVMGLGTAARNVVNVPAFVFSALHSPKDFANSVNAILAMNSAAGRAFANNATRPTYRNFDVAGGYEGNPDKFVRVVNTMSDFMRKWTGRDLSNHMEGLYQYSLGELLAHSNIRAAREGNNNAKRFLKQYGDLIEGGYERLLNPETIILPDHIQRIAKRFVDAMRGTYSAEGLPTWAMEGPLAPFAALSRFNIEKSNRIFKDVIIPAKKGNFLPLLTYTLGSVMSYGMIQWINEQLNAGRKGNDPTWKEINEEGDAKDKIAKIVAMMQMSSYAGAVSDYMRLIVNAAQGKGLKYSNPLSLPMYTLATETLAGNVADALGAINDGEPILDVLAQLPKVIAIQSTQVARYANAYLDPETTQRKEAYRDMRVYRELTSTGEGATRQDSAPNEFADLTYKRFKREKDIGKAQEMLPEVVDVMIRKSAGKDGQIDLVKLSKEMESLKRNSYQTMPSPERLFGIEFANYYNFLVKTQGEEKANQTLKDYILQNAIDRAKSKMVGSM